MKKRPQPLSACRTLFACLAGLGTSPLPIACPQAPPQSGATAKTPSTTQARPNPLHVDEDWTTPTLTGTRLRAIQPLVTNQKETPHYYRELVALQWRPNDPIYLHIIRPKGVEKPPVVLYLYGYPSTTDRFLNNDYCERLTANGCAAVGFVSALTGERYRLRPMKEWFVSELQEALACSAHDVQLILNYLATRNDLDRNRVGMFGQGSGGAIALLAASVDSRIQALDLLNPWGDWQNWMALSKLVPKDERALYVTPEFQGKVAPLEPVTSLAHLKSCRLRIQFVQDDPATPSVCQENLAKAAPPDTRIVRFKDNLACYRATSGGRLFVWLGEQLRAAPKSARK